MTVILFVCNVAVDICTDEDDFEVGTEIAFGATRGGKVGAAWAYEGSIASTYLPWKMLRGTRKTKPHTLPGTHTSAPGYQLQPHRQCSGHWQYRTHTTLAGLRAHTHNARTGRRQACYGG